VTATETESEPSTGRRRRARAGNGGGINLVIVESPHKAQMIASFLGSDYVVESSIGHIRDLPRNAADIPAKYKGESWARLGVNVDNGFEPIYVVSPDRKPQVARLKELVKEASQVYLATDEDREGHRLASHPDAEADRAGAPDGVPRDHAAGDRRSGGQPA
jgi:DNA topoisomerase-1